MAGDNPTHKLVPLPKISARYLADYMAASDIAKRTIIRDAKYRSIAPMMNHWDAKSAISSFYEDGGNDPTILSNAIDEITDKEAKSNFLESVNQNNVDFLNRFESQLGKIDFGKGEVSPRGNCPAISLGGVEISPDVVFRLSRVKRTNMACIGAGGIRYIKGKASKAEACEWQAAFIHGYMISLNDDDSVVVEKDLCVIVDAFSGKVHQAPSNSVSRFNNMRAACMTIADAWNSISPPPKAKL